MHIRQAITTRFVGPTNRRGSRIIARAVAGRKTVHWDHTLNIEANHAAAARRLAESFGWHGQWFGGGLPTEDGYCFVLAEDSELNPARAFVIVKTLENVG